MIRAVPHRTPGEFLTRAGEWLNALEAHHNLILSLAGGRAEAGEWPEGSIFVSLERAGAVVGCALRTPPHKLLVTDMPLDAAPVVAGLAAERYQEMPGVLGPPPAAEAVARAWVELRGGVWRPGMRQGIYRLDEVVHPDPVPGAMRTATSADLDVAIVWGEGFSREVGVRFPTKREAVERWIALERLHIWDDAETAVSIAVAQGQTASGVRIGYVYTPPELRRRGYASALVAALSQKMLDSGRGFCVLYTDLSNPTSNAIYRAVGYELIQEVRDFDLVDEEGL